MSEHIAKRQRLTGSFSPASPPYHVAAKSSETKTPIDQPNTPTSPPYPSMSSQSNGGPATTAHPAPFAMTPPSSVHMSQQPSQSGLSATPVHAFPTPASTAALSSSINVDGDGDLQMEEGQADDAVRLGGHRLTNHNRQNRVVFAADGAVAASKGICGSQLFKLCQSTHEPSRPHGSQDLIGLYGLNGLARSVARTDPSTGEKINKLRKSYEGHIKALQIAGKPKAVKMEGKFTNLVGWGDDDYYLSAVNGKEMHKATNGAGGLSADFEDLVNGALGGMDKGPLPTAEANKYRSYLGTDETVKPKAPGEGAPPRGMPSAATTPNPQASSAASRLARPERTGSKRQYTDASFHGYGEGFTDDYAESTGGEDNNGMAAKRRKLAAFERTSHQVEVGGARR
ncbi:Rox3-domain-containing protein [Bimuria novae-zelandiae CBS 107.79]|uniref:Mediator of RNA polymerase II transcription subunit 19 n=1 Tax=Bimuria novae-zelandiae CBS 107.79 TaxID=1447943 RepID=A0A6A5UUY1_9PLEO|nr:Rox3-domain-containing protein [Bimuria novae-zelandiae CBS 107.79]